MNPRSSSPKTRGARFASALCWLGLVTCSTGEPPRDSPSTAGGAPAAAGSTHSAGEDSTAAGAPPTAGASSSAGSPSEAPDDSAGAGGAAPSENGTAGENPGAAGAGSEPTLFSDAPPYAPPIVPLARELCDRDPSGLPCLDCHNILHEAPFALGGTVYRDASRTARAAGAEVRVVDAAGTARSVYSDAEGNFWLPRSDLAGQPPFQLGARDAWNERIMPLVQPSLNCNQAACHGGPVGPIQLPNVE